MSNGDKPVERCQNCGQLKEIHTGLQKRCGGIYSSCWSPQPAVTEGPYKVMDDGASKFLTYDHYVSGPGLTSPKQTDSAEWIAEDTKRNMNLAFAQGASSKQAEVDKLKAENEGLRGALEEIIKGVNENPESYETVMESQNFGDCYYSGADNEHLRLATIARKALSAHRDGEGVGG